MKALKLYSGSILINLIPIIAMRLIMGNTTGDENIGYLIWGVFFIVASFLNTSFFFINTESIQKNSILFFLSYYLSSTFLFVFGSLLVLYDYVINTINSLRDILLPLILYYSYFVINLLYALYIKRRSIRDK